MAVGLRDVTQMTGIKGHALHGLQNGFMVPFEIRWRLDLRRLSSLTGVLDTRAGNG
jgi:hypothetical protein